MAWSPRGSPYRDRRKKSIMRRVLLEGGFVPRFLPCREKKKHLMKNTS
jgi:hypothetical protein